MKKTFLITLITILSFFSVTAFAQTDKAPKWVPQSGYWVVETNTHDQKSSIIYFYNNNDEMVYKEKVEGMVIRTKKRSVKMNLKKVLDRSVLAYNTKHKAGENEMLVANLIKKH